MEVAEFMRRLSAATEANDIAAMKSLISFAKANADAATKMAYAATHAELLVHMLTRGKSEAGHG